MFKRLTPSLLLRAAVVAAGGAAVVFGSYGMLKRVLRARENTELRAAPGALGMPGMSDEEILRASGRPETETYAALVRLAERKVPLARERALQLAKSPSALLRRGAYEALGFFVDTQADAALKAGLQDTDSMARETVLRALGYSGSASRKQLLKEELHSGTLSPSMRVALLSSLLRQDRAGAESNELVDALISIGSKTGDYDLADSVVENVQAVRPRSAELRHALREALEERPASALAASAVRYLAMNEPAELGSLYQKAMLSTDSRVRAAALDVVHYVCPADRWKLLQTIATNEKDPLVRASAVRQLIAVPVPAATETAKALLKSGNFPPDLKAQLAALVRRPPSGATDPCARGTGAPAVGSH